MRTALAIVIGITGLVATGCSSDGVTTDDIWDLAREEGFTNDAFGIVRIVSIDASANREFQGFEYQEVA